MTKKSKKHFNSLRSLSARLCKAINTKGKKCIVPAANGSDYCFRHKKK